MNRDLMILVIGSFLMLAGLIRILYVDEVCDEVVKKHIGDSIPRSTEVYITGNYLTGECSYYTTSQTIEVK